ncbi:MAG: hypothetical protein Q8P91_02870 [bacterium]|nr:hypothetical protein [bacterium]
MSLPGIPSMPSDPWLVIAYLTATYGNSPYVKIGAAVLGGFIFLLLFGMVRKHIFEVSMRGALFGFVAGILLMVILDLAIIFGMTDKTKVAKLNQEQNREAAIQEIIIS